MTNEQDMYKGELGYTKGFIRLVRNKIALLPKITNKTQSMKISDIYKPRAPRLTIITAEPVPVAERIKQGAGYIFSTDDNTGEMTPKKRLNYSPTQARNNVPTDGSTGPSLIAYGCPISGNHDVLNPEWIPDKLWNEACETAIATYKTYIPPQYEHMLHDLEEHDIHGLENSLFGKAKSDPVKFCGLLHTQIEELEVHPSTFNEEGSL